MPAIRLEGVAVDVPVADGGSRRLLDVPFLELTEDRVSVVGANGSGKSTLLRLLNGLVRPTHGRVLVDGRDTVGQGAAVRRQVAFAFTDPLSQLVMPTGREDVELSLRRSHRDRRARRAAAQAVLDRFGLGAIADHSVYDLSGGERQLMALAAVLAAEPDILVLDEPSTLLDLRNTLLLRATLASLPQRVVLATHDLDLALEAERTLVIDAGRVVFDGSPARAVAHYRSRCAPPSARP
ncbi:MAG TPA: ABC transporter ATP-binding protein [Intrasporangium sp.]|uniref:energy-coupling factor ABC transporter ATP-binding protein n=1 Tax=Intrasporangium sp. TaxID=1925024 RepID=UPI002D7925A6|nr:ABC transporter ATP-binding protein [Intrasporangium sp.]HET7398334.1 ABC transporter ATP-binding protein [Intrasporangium sp.]